MQSAHDVPLVFRRRRRFAGSYECVFVRMCSTCDVHRTRSPLVVQNVCILLAAECALASSSQCARKLLHTNRPTKLIITRRCPIVCSTVLVELKSLWWYYIHRVDVCLFYASCVCAQVRAYSSSSTAWRLSKCATRRKAKARADNGVKLISIRFVVEEMHKTQSNNYATNTTVVDVCRNAVYGVCCVDCIPAMLLKCACL